MKKVNPLKKYSDIDEAYSSSKQTLDLLIPANFRLLCTLMEVDIGEVLSQYMWTLSFMPGFNTKERQGMLLEHFLICGYGSDKYTEDERKQLFAELEAMQLLWPGTDDRAMSRDDLPLHYAWSNMYLQYWFKKWADKK